MDRGPSNDLKVNSEHICLFHTVLSSLRCHGTCPVLTVSFSKYSMYTEYNSRMDLTTYCDTAGKLAPLQESSL